MAMGSEALGIYRGYAPLDTPLLPNVTGPSILESGCMNCGSGIPF